MLQRDTSFFGKSQPKPPETPARGAAAPAAAPTTPAAPPVNQNDDSRRANRVAAPGETQGSQLIVGPNIKLKGVEITDCDTLVVEGHVEATMDSRAIQISQQGTFSGTAGIDIAEIHGNFSGEMTVRNCLTIRTTGKVSGKVRYGKVVIEEGGELSGDVRKISDEDRVARAQPATTVPRPVSAHHN